MKYTIAIMALLSQASAIQYRENTADFFAAKNFGMDQYSYAENEDRKREVNAAIKEVTISDLKEDTKVSLANVEKFHKMEEQSLETKKVWEDLLARKQEHQHQTRDLSHSR